MDIKYKKFIDDMCFKLQAEYDAQTEYDNINVYNLSRFPDFIEEEERLFPGKNHIQAVIDLFERMDEKPSPTE